MKTIILSLQKKWTYSYFYENFLKVGFAKEVISN